MFAEMLKRWGTVDILVNNAGLQRDAKFVEMTLEQWNFVLGVNLTGMFLCARAAAREFIRRGVKPEVSRAAGKIICMSSVHELIPWAGHVNYASSKGGVRMLMQSLAQELAPHQDPRELDRSRRHRDADQPARVGDARGAQGLAHARSRTAAWACRKTSARPPSGSLPTTRTTCTARRSSSTAA